MTAFCEFRSLCVKKYRDQGTEIKTTRDSMFSNQATSMYIEKICFVSEIVKCTVQEINVLQIVE